VLQIDLMYGSAVAPLTGVSDPDDREAAGLSGGPAARKRLTAGCADHHLSASMSTTSGPEFTFEPNVSIEPGLGVPDVGNLHLDVGTGVQFAMRPSRCE
jgi:hypothetical protein